MEGEREGGRNTEGAESNGTKKKGGGEGDTLEKV